MPPGVTQGFGQGFIGFPVPGMHFAIGGGHPHGLRLAGGGQPQQRGQGDSGDEDGADESANDDGFAEHFASPLAVRRCAAAINWTYALTSPTVPREFCHG